MTNTTLVLIVSIIAILVYIKVFVLDRKQKVDNGFEFENGMLAGNAQFIGNRDNQNDYFAILPNKNSIFAVIADGLNDKKVGKEAAVIAVEILKYNFLQELHKKTSVSQFFLDSFKSIKKRLNDSAYGNKFGVTLIAVLVESDILHYASIGDCTLFLHRNDELNNININNNELQIKELSLKQGDIVMLASRGACESLTEGEILWQLSQEGHPHHKCQELLRKMRQKQLGAQENATIVILQELTEKI